MIQVSAYNPDDKHFFAQKLAQTMQNPVFLCIGTEKVLSDSLGPRVGSLLNLNMDAPYFVYGMQGQNVTAENLVYCHNFVKNLHPNSQIVVIDAAVGNAEQIGNVQLCNEGIFPGAATNKNLPKVGDVGIVGIVADKGMADFYTLNSDKDKLVGEVAQFVCDCIILATKLTQ